MAVDRQMHQRPVIDAVMIHILVVVAVLVGRRGRIGGRRDGGRHGDVVGEHGHELVVVQAVEGGGDVVGAVHGRVPPAFLVQRVQRRLEERDGVARRAPVGPAPGGREVEKLVHPTRRRRGLVLRRGRRRLVDGGGGEIGHGGHSVVGEGRPILSHAWYFRRQLRHGLSQWESPLPNIEGVGVGVVVPNWVY